MSDDPKRSVKSKVTGGAAVLVGVAVIAVYVLYAISSSSGAAPMLLLLLQILSVASIVLGLAALFRRRWICALIAIVCPLLLPIFDLVVRALRGVPVN